MPSPRKSKDVGLWFYSLPKGKNSRKLKENDNKLLDFAFSQNTLQEAANKIILTNWVLSRMLRYQPSKEEWISNSKWAFLPSAESLKSSTLPLYSVCQPICKERHHLKLHIHPKWLSCETYTHRLHSQAPLKAWWVRRKEKKAKEIFWQVFWTLGIP